MKNIDLLKRLTDVNGISGYEREVRELMAEEFSSAGFDVTYDNLGSIVGTKIGKSNGPKIAIVGHMDEIGFIVTKISEEGYLSIQPIGGWWPHVMLSQQFNVITSDGKKYRAVTGSKPPHILQPEERVRVLKIDEIHLDLGVKNKEEVEALGIKLGDQVVPSIEFQVMANPDFLLAKAFDNRIGCAIAIDVLNELKDVEHQNIVHGVGTVQEEVGLRGAKTTGNMLDPDVVFAVDVTVATDTPGLSKSNKMGDGPVILLKDGATIGHRGLREFVIKVCNELNIPYQIDYLASGGTDAGAMHVAHSGAPSMSLCIASRYIHSHTSMISRVDYENCVKLLVEVVKRLDCENLSNIKFA